MKDLIAVERIYIQWCDLNVFFQNSFVEILISKVVVCGRGPVRGD